MKILFLSPEVAPFVKAGGLGDVSKALPAALARLGHEVMVVMPRYASIERAQLEPLDAHIRLKFPFGDEYAELLAKEVGEGHEVIFIDHPGFYGRRGVYGERGGEYGDNARRFAFFSIGALAAAQRLGFEPDVVHLNDWQTGLAALALRHGYAHHAIGRAKIVFNVHNLAYQGLFGKSVMDDLGIPWGAFNPDGVEFHDAVSFLKAGLSYADHIVAVSPRYAREIQTPELGCELDAFLRARSNRVSGILNGVDYSEWDPSTDALLPARYSADDFSGKDTCKRILREKLGLPPAQGRRPLFGLVARLVQQKGIDLMLRTLPRLLRHPVDVVLLGSGEDRLEHGLNALRARFPSQVGVYIGYNNALAHLVEAGSDFFLMPSLYEPCGLNQMYSLRYGTPPIVRATGGLDDSVLDVDQPNGNGFKFQSYDENALLWAMDRARELYQSEDEYLALRRTGMAVDHSWEQSAQRYVDLYQRDVLPVAPAESG
jgi:starch synthase